MQSIRQDPSARLKNVRGFTLIELLIVIVIISMLIALLLPVLANIQQSGQVARVKNELSQLETAILAFKNTYGIEPPSRFVLYEDFNDYGIAEADPVLDSLRSKSRGAISRMWPQFDFTQGRDWDNDTVITSGSSFVLNGAECLVFFLGGIIEGPASPPNLTGFSKNPATPFDSGSNREGPFFEFSTSRIQDVQNTSADSGLDGMGVLNIPEYLDPLEGQSSPYFYVHRDYYRAHDQEEFASLSPALPVELEPRAYKQSDANRSYYKKQTFQLISPGFDGVYGSGGIYEEDDSDHDGETVPLHINEFDRDNITNFSSGMLRQ